MHPRTPHPCPDCGTRTYGSFTQARYCQPCAAQRSPDGDTYQPHDRIGAPVVIGPRGYRHSYTPAPAFGPAAPPVATEPEPEGRCNWELVLVGLACVVFWGVVIVLIRRCF